MKAQLAPRIAVVGGADCSQAEAQAAEAVGRLLAQAGAVVICGGRGGVMAAACRGAREAGGLTVGILPGDDPSEANPWVALPIATGLGEARNVLVVRSAQAVIAIGGEWGTLSEVAFALKFGKPVVALSSLPAGAALPVPLVQDAEDAVRLALGVDGG